MGNRYLDIKEFINLGLLQEVNRRFFHPMGLALEVSCSDDDEFYISGVQDHREDPEGVVFCNDMHPDEVNSKAEAVENMFLAHEHHRLDRFDFVVQPLEEMYRGFYEDDE